MLHCIAALLNATTVLLSSLRYDGAGPKTNWIVGTKNPIGVDANTFIIDRLTETGEVGEKKDKNLEYNHPAWNILVFTLFLSNQKKPNYLDPDQDVIMWSAGGVQCEWPEQRSAESGQLQRKESHSQPPAAGG